MNGRLVFAAGLIAIWASSIGAEARSPFVEQYEVLLHELGLDPGTIDGQFDGELAAAVRAFQFAVGLPDDGVLTLETQFAIDAAADAAAIPARLDWNNR